jgi:hypothetical protein
MKTLVELLNAEILANEGEDVAGLVGAVQEWLGQNGVGAIMYDAFAQDPGRMIERMRGALQREAGRGLGG